MSKSIEPMRFTPNRLREAAEFSFLDLNYYFHIYTSFVTTALFSSIAIVDDHEILRETLSAFINKFSGFSVRLTSPNGKDFITHLLRGESVDIVILDLNMPEMNGYETAAWLKENRPDIKIIVLTMYENEYVNLELLQLGVRGILSKNISSAQFGQALECISYGGYYYGSIDAKKPLALRRGSLQTRTFNKKESDFLKLIVTDLSYKEIADKLKSSIRTVEAYKSTFCEKFGVCSRVGLAMYVLTNGIVVP